MRAHAAHATNGIAAKRSRRLDLRRVWVQVHLWLGLTLGVVGALLGVTGSLLVFDHAIDARLNPQRYATTGSQAALPYADYAKRGVAAVGEGARALNVSMPQPGDGPVTVLVRPRGEGGGPRRVYLDPPTGRVLDAPESGGGLIGLAHDLHGSLKLREYSGREIVGVVGIAMLISSLSGIYLWWPRRRLARTDFGFRPRLALSRNLHYALGLYGFIVLAMLSFTGIVIAFPDAGRAVVATFAKLSPSIRGIQAPEAQGPMINPDQAVEIARSRYPNASVASIGLPAGPRGSYRVSLREAGDDSARGTTIVFVDPRAATVLRQVDRSNQTGGDAFLAFMRPLHEGDPLGLAGRAIIFVVGLFPVLFVVTGAIMWLRSRRRSAPA